MLPPLVVPFVVPFVDGPLLCGSPPPVPGVMSPCAHPTSDAPSTIESSIRFVIGEAPFTSAACPSKPKAKRAYMYGREIAHALDGLGPFVPSVLGPTVPSVRRFCAYPSSSNSHAASKYRKQHTISY